MVTTDKIKRGIAKYIDEEFTSKIYGWQKWAFGAGAALAIDNSDQLIEKCRANTIVSAMGIFDDGGGVDVERAYRYLKAEAEKTPVTFDAPIIGSVTLNAADVDKLYQAIMQS